MSWHLPHRLTTVHYAVSIALLYSTSSLGLISGAQAANFGKMQITSAQHEPLVASIPVSEIESASFAASLASSNVYQQMGLTPTASMSIRFVPTSATTGQVLISTSQPVSKPFADVVLTIDDKGKRNIIPKTLLMPLGDHSSTDGSTKRPNQVLGTTVKPNLPVVSNIVSNIIANPTVQPLKVKREAPPPLFATPNIQAPIATPTSSVDNVVMAQDKDIGSAIISANTAPLSSFSSTTVTSNITRKVKKADRNSNINLDITTALNASNSAADDNDSYANANANANANAANLGLNDDLTANDQQMVATTADAAPMPLSTQQDLLNIKVTRRIEAKKDNDTGNILANKALASSSAQQGSTQQQATSTTTNEQPNQSNDGSTIGSQATAKQTTSYTVQRNDNLWIISEQIAQQNNLDVQSVMRQIKAQNPEAFINRNADQLMADAKLSLPNYEVVPSQQSLQSAISAQRQHYLQAAKSKSVAKALKPKVSPKPTSAKSAANKTKNTQAAKRDAKPTTTITKTLPKAHFSVIAPGRDGSADGTQTKATAATGNGLSTDILATLKSTRQRTADQVKSLVDTSSTLSRYTEKLKLQNQKLAELEARLKTLRNQ
ncbi:type IV pilus assembly protein FimV [Psychrobacter jeotgali]|uniref:type IV pilus assembly protein FimV n=1 Tax=Psychrobacter jeotgali TaxID=179010 RepID=UPI00191A126F|nr:peptigoglycan-binding protein LysM [Psychrobacter jeotgali]